MARETRTAQEAADDLGIGVSTFYGWLAQSDAGTFFLQGEHITIEYRQSGPQGQGRIQIDAAEVERLKQAMRVRPRLSRERRRPSVRQHYPGITVPLGRPDD